MVPGKGGLSRFNYRERVGSGDGGGRGGVWQGEARSRSFIQGISYRAIVVIFYVSYLNLKRGVVLTTLHDHIDFFLFLLLFSKRDM